MFYVGVARELCAWNPPRLFRRSANVEPILATSVAAQQKVQIVLKSVRHLFITTVNCLSLAVASYCCCWDCVVGMCIQPSSKRQTWLDWISLSLVCSDWAIMPGVASIGLSSHAWLYIWFQCDFFLFSLISMRSVLWHCGWLAGNGTYRRFLESCGHRRRRRGPPKKFRKKYFSCKI